MNIIGHVIIAGIPFINGKPAILDPPEEEILLLNGALSEWRCPECNARLSGEGMICLNACHLSAASFRRFQELMGQAVARVKRREAIKEQLKKESGVLGEFLGEIADPEDFDLK